MSKEDILNRLGGFHPGEAPLEDEAAAEIRRLRQFEAKYDALMLDLESHPSAKFTALEVERDHFVKKYEAAESELARLREFEAREAIVSNLMAAFVAFQDDKISPYEFQALITQSEAAMCQAVEALGRRDKIRKLEGNLEEVERLIRDLHAKAEVATAYSKHGTAARRRGDADELKLNRLVELQHQLAKARAGK